MEHIEEDSEMKPETSNRNIPGTSKFLTQEDIISTANADIASNESNYQKSVNSQIDVMHTPSNSSDFKKKLE